MKCLQPSSPQATPEPAITPAFFHPQLRSRLFVTFFALTYSAKKAKKLLFAYTAGLNPQKGNLLAHCGQKGNLLF